MRRKIAALFARLALCAVPLSGSAAAAALQWESERVLLTPSPGAAMAEAEFKFTNRGESVVRVLETRSSCGCTVAELEEKVFRPGESGRVSVRYEVGERDGHDAVTVWVTTDESKVQPYVLTIEVEIKNPVRLLPRYLFWKIGEAPAPKPMQVRVREGWRVESVAVDAGEFAAELVHGDDGAVQIQVTPRDTWARRATTLRIKVATGDEPPIECLAWVRVL